MPSGGILESRRPHPGTGRMGGPKEAGLLQPHARGHAASQRMPRAACSGRCYSRAQIIRGWEKTAGVRACGWCKPGDPGKVCFGVNLKRLQSESRRSGNSPTRRHVLTRVTLAVIRSQRARRDRGCAHGGGANTCALRAPWWVAMHVLRGPRSPWPRSPSSARVWRCFPLATHLVGVQPDVGQPVLCLAPLRLPHPDHRRHSRASERHA